MEYLDLQNCTENPMGEKAGEMICGKKEEICEGQA